MMPCNLTCLLGIKSMITGNLLEAFTISLDEENIVSRIPEGPRNGRGRHIYGGFEIEF